MPKDPNATSDAASPTPAAGSTPAAGQGQATTQPTAPKRFAITVKDADGKETDELETNSPDVAYKHLADGDVVIDREHGNKPYGEWLKERDAEQEAKRRKPRTAAAKK